MVLRGGGWLLALSEDSLGRENGGWSPMTLR